MIRFTVSSPLPAAFPKSGLRRMGVVVSRALRIRRDELVGLSFVSSSAMQALNTRYRGTRKPTDVLSFSSDVSARGEAGLGDVVLCPAYASKEARRRGISIEEELIRLVIHGVLHLKGYTHEREREEHTMFALQEKCVEQVLTRRI